MQVELEKSVISWKFLQVSGSYVEDNAVIEALKPYGEIKSKIFRLKYKRDHELAGIENVNRLVKMIVATRSIPYSMKIGG